jgi:hypothetical protein
MSTTLRPTASVQRVDPSSYHAVIASVPHPEYGSPRELVHRLFGIDLRSLAVFRMGLALLLLVDLGSRAVWLRAHYSDEGVLPRRALLEFYDQPYVFSVHLLSGAWQAQALLFSVAGLCAGALLVGYRTRLAAIASWILLVSLQARNPLVLQGGDVLLRCMLFWSLFLPLGAVFSVDRALARSAPFLPRSICSVATVALLLQVCVMYLVTGYLKTDAVWTRDGTAIQYALSLSSFGTAFGTWLLGYPTLLKMLTFSCVALERFGPLLVFVPLARGWVRAIVIAAFMSLHLGMALSLRLGPFPYICLVAWIPFLPSVFWDAVGRRFRLGSGLTLYIDHQRPSCPVLARFLTMVLFVPRTQCLSLQDFPELGALASARTPWLAQEGAQISDGWAGVACLFRHSPWAWWLSPLIAKGPLRQRGPRLLAWISDDQRWWSLRLRTRAAPGIGLPRLVSLLCAGLVAVMLLWNLRILDPKAGTRLLPHRLDLLAQIPRLDQHWNMFAPFPTRTDGFYAIPAHLRDGSEVDLLTAGVALTSVHGSAHTAFYQSERWRKFLSNFHADSSTRVRTFFAQYLYRDWNLHHADQPGKLIDWLSIDFSSQKTSLGSPEPLHHTTLWIYTPHGTPATRAASHAPVHARPAPAGSPHAGSTVAHSGPTPVSASSAPAPMPSDDQATPAAHAPTAPADPPASDKPSAPADVDTDAL